MIFFFLENFVLTIDKKETYRAVIVTGLNGFLLGEDQNYWSREFKRSLVKRFPGTLTRFIFLLFCYWFFEWWFERTEIEDECIDVRLWTR